MYGKWVDLDDLNSTFSAVVVGDFVVSNITLGQCLSSLSIHSPAIFDAVAHPIAAVISSEGVGRVRPADKISNALSAKNKNSRLHFLFPYGGIPPFSPNTNNLLHL
jgi:hypothetical protein